VLTAGDDGTARLWDSASGSPISTLPGHTGPVTSAVFSPDGRYIATAGRDAIVQIHLSRLADLVVLAVKGLGPVSPSRLSAAGLQDLQSRMPSASDRTAVAEPDLSDVHPPPLLVAGTVAQPPAISCADAVYWKPVGAAHPRLGCATVASTTDSTYRQYERGWMIWRKSPSPSQVYVLTQSPRGNRWQAFQDYSTDPEVARTPGQGCPEYEHSGGKPPVASLIPSGASRAIWCSNSTTDWC
jgi:hypothetical protein